LFTNSIVCWRWCLLLLHSGGAKLNSRRPKSLLAIRNWLHLAIATSSPTGSPEEPPRPQSPLLLARLRELFRYRDLIRNLVVSEVKSRYKNSILGFVWSLLNPLAMMLVFTIVFDVLWPNQTMEKYPIFLLCGLLPWNFFSA